MVVHMKANRAPAEQREQEMSSASMGRHLKGLYHFVRQQLAYLEATGDLVPGELTADDVVDTVLTRAYPQLPAAPSARQVRRVLLRLAREYLREEVTRLQSWRRRTPVRTEQHVPETPPLEYVSRLGEEILEFYQPDEDLKVEDVLPDYKAPTPEHVVEFEERLWCVDTALAGMPEEWREALLRRYVGGLSEAEVATAMGKPEPEVRKMLDQGRERLRQRLVESGCTFTE
jgi:RNA polymerase sigma factor (sigma-70 family)